jgi:hypothetical protein
VSQVRHDPFKPCPVTGEQIPFGTAWTDHDLPGLFNACAACSDKYPKTLEELRDERERDALSCAQGGAA